MADPLPLDVLTRVINVQWPSVSVSITYNWFSVLGGAGGFPLTFSPAFEFGVTTTGWTVSGASPSPPSAVPSPGPEYFLPSIFPDQSVLAHGSGSATFDVVSFFDPGPGAPVIVAAGDTTVSWGDFTATNDETGEIWVVDFVTASGGSSEAISSVSVVVVFRPPG